VPLVAWRGQKVQSWREYFSPRGRKIAISWAATMFDQQGGIAAINTDAPRAPSTGAPLDLIGEFAAHNVVPWVKDDARGLPGDPFCGGHRVSRAGQTTRARTSQEEAVMTTISTTISTRGPKRSAPGLTDAAI
jgi:hypothetical protein